MAFTITKSALIFIAAVLVLRRVIFGNAKHTFPPGPQSSFWLGNLKDFPTSKAWCTFASWKKQYGGLVYLRVLGHNILIVNSRKEAIELFEKRSKIYSDRHRVPIVDMMGWSFNTAIMQYSDKWRLHRKIYQQFLRPQIAASFQPIQREKMHVMLCDLLDSPENFVEHYRKLSGAIIMKIIYGIDVAPQHDFYLEIAEAADKYTAEAAIPGAMLVNILPIMRHIPAWFPGAYFKRLAMETKKLTSTIFTAPFEFAQKNPDPSSSVAMKLIADSRSRGGSDVEEYAIQEVCATSFAGGADTTASVIGTFFLAMATYPDTQKRAQREIDDVVGDSRLPEYEDRASLPYIEAVYREVMRWQQVTPVAVPRSTMSDDVYKGYFIPKGTTVIPNIWGMAHDEDVYPFPDEFRPERFFKENGTLNDDTSNLAFGFGRRVCPGRHMASATVWLAIATVLSVFDIRKAKDENGNDIPIKVEYTDSIISHPTPFKCSITPRSEAAGQLVRDVN